MTTIRIEVIHYTEDKVYSESHSLPLEKITDWHPFQAEEIIQALLRKIEALKNNQPVKQ